MITRLSLNNFKSVGKEVYDFNNFELLVGRNNSGKSTILQALAIWQFCVDEFHRSKRHGSKGIQIVLPNFTALPVPEFNLLWKDRTDRAYPLKNGKKKQEFILIEIKVDWLHDVNTPGSFGVELRYHSSQTIYAIPSGGWSNFREYEKKKILPNLAYVPPFSGLEPTEKWLDVSPIRQQIGKGQPGSVLRNLLLRVSQPQYNKSENGKKLKSNQIPADWKEVAKVIKRWFAVNICEPEYESSKDVNITVEYKQNDKNYDIISGGSGFHQVLTLLAFMYGYRATTILLDEPDAHLHVNLQREILDYFKIKSDERKTQFLIATHAEEFVKGVDSSQIVSLLSHKPKRINSTPEVIKAMADVSNEEVVQLMVSPFILYVEGESDERILRAWASKYSFQDIMDKVFIKLMNGGSKEKMKTLADEHFDALHQIIPGVKRLMLFDLDTEKTSFHPDSNNPTLFEWKRKNIENYLLVKDAWERAALQKLEGGEDLFSSSVLKIIDAFFSDQNLTLPTGNTWKNVKARIFNIVDGKDILFENKDSLFQQLKNGHPPLSLIREQVAINMLETEIHGDVKEFFEKLASVVNGSEA